VLAPGPLPPGDAPPPIGVPNWHASAKTGVALRASGNKRRDHMVVLRQALHARAHIANAIALWCHIGTAPAGLGNGAYHPPVITIRRASSGDAEAITAVYLASFRGALPQVRLVHTDGEVRAWIAGHVIPALETWVADDDGEVVAMMALEPGWIEQLYVAPGRTGEGIGGQLLALAKERATGPIDLWTFQVNAGARRFYERNGFVAVEFTDGSGNEEREPDVRYRWEPPKG
jgi:GNAT superfamily N-acetyltransferase